MVKYLFGFLFLMPYLLAQRPIGGANASPAIPATVMQTNQSNTVTAGTQDDSGAAHTIPAKTGTVAAKPATCMVGEQYFATDATQGQNLYLCGATNVWTQQLDTSGGNGALGYSGAALATVTGTVYCAISGGGVCSVTESNVQQQSATQSTATAFAATLSQALGGGNSVALTLRKCTPSSGTCTGSDQSVTCTISGATATGCLDAVHSFAISQGDYLSVKLAFLGTVLVNPALSSQTQIGTTTSAGSVNTGTINQSGCYTVAGTAISGVTGPCGGANAVNVSITTASLGTQAVCALHTDSGCFNSVTDATAANCPAGTLSAPCTFPTSITLPANTLGTTATKIDFLIGALATATVPTSIVEIYLDNTRIFSGTVAAGGAGSRTLNYSCLIAALASSASAPLAMGCNGAGTVPAGGASFSANALNTNAAPAIAIDTTVSHVLKVSIAYTSNTTGNSAWLYGMRFQP